MADEIEVVTTPAGYEAFGALIREYWDWLQARYADLPGLIDLIGSHQALDTELADLPGTYGPPLGRTLLARRGGGVTGGVAFRSLGDGACEMKRLFVPDRFQGHGTGRLLCQAVVDAATADGYDSMLLDTGYMNTEALAMYASIGFVDCPPYHDYPPEVMPHLRFLRVSLTSATG